MLSIPLILAAGSLPTLISGLPVPSFLSGIVETVRYSHSLERRESATSYVTFGGDGETADGWPAVSDWVPDFDTMFAANQGVMSSSCSQFGVADNSDSEIAEISSAIQSVASSTGVDARFILAIVMQESNGCVRAPTTNYGVRNPGLMQSHNGAGTCNDATVSNPCPSSEITQMIEDGTAGTSSGDGLKQCLTESGATDASMYYKAARIYNSGSIASNGNLGAGIATHCYASDVANRLIGWSSGASGCSSTAVETLTTSSSFVSGNSGSSGSDSSSVAVPATTSSEAAPVATNSAQASTSSIPGGAFLQTATSIALEPSAKAVSTPTSESVTTATVESVPATTTAASDPTSSAAASPVVSSSPVSSVAASSVAPVASPASTGIVGTGSAIAAGTACTTEGMWNCIGGTSFQQCASGTWSVVEEMAAGTTCTSGQTMSIDIIAAKRVVRFSSEHVRRSIHQS